ncbi:MAG TPA: EamA family transporter [Phycisphaerae bacterium]|nr:EamA family transporter [Phycisphaerae bacterium]
MNWGALNVWWVYALASAFFAALTAVLAKVGVKGIDSDLATAIRTIVILIITWGIVFFKNGAGGLNSLSKNNVLFLVLSGIATGLSWLFYFRALQMGKVSHVAAVDKTSVALAMILAVIFLHDALSLKLILGVLMVMAGTMIIIL